MSVDEGRDAVSECFAVGTGLDREGDEGDRVFDCVGGGGHRPMVRLTSVPTSTTSYRLTFAPTMCHTEAPYQ
ncbi:hypothetical protein GCM10022225_71530 [Plantactinospora mayteni]|uniref:Uncharacterized protein n=1 Tax=Plantactinospora mayteni TaxID=566021 RepID=A0ABQ4F110_9ACTN|nr:hypothetical protein Pma05_71780 [Plantactinospora mayteni]